MSDSTALPASAELHPHWADSTSQEPYVEAEWRTLNNDLFDVPIPVPHMRWLAADALMMLSIIAEHPDVPERIKRTAVRGIRNARNRVEQARGRETSV